MSENTNKDQKDNNNDNNKSEVNVFDQLKEIKLSDFKNIFQIPCTRTGLLYGVGGGMSLGLLHFMISWKRKGAILKEFINSKTVMASCHRAVGGFAFVSILSWEKCKYDRKVAAQKVQLVAEQFKRMEKKRAEKENENEEKNVDSTKNTNT
ncbi:hypothetical protein K502DRAFT_368333 [Neoconidiobolus thromboides FSU 785]|nr:hypothetical protein K502DRAFT_368333 [Neoconidiobolus thromboides FSU 785]